MREEGEGGGGRREGGGGGETNLVFSREGVWTGEEGA